MVIASANKLTIMRCLSTGSYSYNHKANYRLPRGKIQRVCLVEVKVSDNLRNQNVASRTVWFSVSCTFTFYRLFRLYVEREGQHLRRDYACYFCACGRRRLMTTRISDWVFPLRGPFISHPPRTCLAWSSAAPYRKKCCLAAQLFLPPLFAFARGGTHAVLCWITSAWIRVRSFARSPVYDHFYSSRLNYFCLLRY